MAPTLRVQKYRDRRAVAYTLRVQKYRDLRAVSPTLLFKTFVFVPGQAAKASPLFPLTFYFSMLLLSYVVLFLVRNQ